MKGVLSTEDLQKVFCHHRTCMKSSVYRRPVRALLSVEPVRGLLSLEDLQMFSAYGRSANGLLSLEDL